MKIEYIYPDFVIKQVEQYRLKIQEIMESHFDNIDSASAFGIRQMTEAMKDMDNDPSIKLLEKAIENLYLRSASRMVVTAESDEDNKKLKEFIERDRNG